MKIEKSSSREPNRAPIQVKRNKSTNLQNENYINFTSENNLQSLVNFALINEFVARDTKHKICFFFSVLDMQRERHIHTKYRSSLIA